MKKSIIYSIIDENQSLIWKDTLISNRNKSDFYLLGSISDIGPNLQDLKNNYNFDVIQIDTKFIDFPVHRNKILDIIFTETKYQYCEFFLSLDSDEELIGNLPNYYLNNVSLYANWFYKYHDMMTNITGIKFRAFSGNQKPKWHGTIHDYIRFNSDKDIYTNDFMIKHLRKNNETNMNYLEKIFENLDESFENKYAFILEASKSNFKYLDNIYEMANNLKIPDYIQGLRREIQFINLTIINYYICRAKNKLEEANLHAETLINLNQRVGIYLKWLLHKTNTENYIKEYTSFPIHLYIQYFEMTPKWT